MIAYLAIPYSHIDKEISRLRFEIANAITALLMKKGEIIFSPISHTHPMVTYGLPSDWEYWKNQDVAFLDVCGKMYIVMLEGWDVSSGVTAESNHMKQRGIEITYIDPYILEDKIIHDMCVAHNKLLKK